MCAVEVRHGRRVFISTTPTCRCCVSASLNLGTVRVAVGRRFSADPQPSHTRQDTAYFSVFSNSQRARGARRPTMVHTPRPDHKHRNSRKRIGMLEVSRTQGRAPTNQAPTLSYQISRHAHKAIKSHDTHKAQVLASGQAHDRSPTGDENKFPTHWITGPSAPKG